MSDELTREQYEATLTCLINCYPDGCRYEEQRDEWIKRFAAHDAALRTALAQAQEQVKLQASYYESEQELTAGLREEITKLTARLAAMEQRYREAVHEDQRTITNLQQQLASKHNFAVVKDIEVRDMPPGRLEPLTPIGRQEERMSNGKDANYWQMSFEEERNLHMETKQQLATAQQENSSVADRAPKKDSSWIVVGAYSFIDRLEAEQRAEEEAKSD